MEQLKIVKDLKIVGHKVLINNLCLFTFFLISSTCNSQHFKISTVFADVEKIDKETVLTDTLSIYFGKVRFGYIKNEKIEVRFYQKFFTSNNFVETNVISVVEKDKITHIRGQLPNIEIIVTNIDYVPLYSYHYCNGYVMLYSEYQLNENKDILETSYFVSKKIKLKRLSEFQIRNFRSNGELRYRTEHHFQNLYNLIW